MRLAQSLLQALRSQPIGGQHMAIWIILICALTYVISWAWLFSRVSQHAARVPEQRQIDTYEEAV